MAQKKRGEPRQPMLILLNHDHDVTLQKYIPLIISEYHKLGQWQFVCMFEISNTRVFNPRVTHDPPGLRILAQVAE